MPTFFMADIEADGPIPGDYSMVSLGFVVVDRALDKTFYGRLKPISERWNPKALSVSGHSREETLLFDEPKEVMQNLRNWVLAHSVGGRSVFVSDNNGFDWQFINWYFHHFLGDNPFGYSSISLGSLYKGAVHDVRNHLSKFRKSALTHHPVEDALANAKALLEMDEVFDLKFDFPPEPEFTLSVRGRHGFMSNRS